MSWRDRESGCAPSELPAKGDVRWVIRPVAASSPMVSIDDRPTEATQRRMPRWWEGDLIVGEGGKSAAPTLVEKTSLFTLILGLSAATWPLGL